MRIVLNAVIMKMILSECLPNCLENNRVRLPKGFVVFWNKFYAVIYGCASASERKTFETALKVSLPKQSCADESGCAMTKRQTGMRFCLRSEQFDLWADRCPYPASLLRMCDVSRKTIYIGEESRKMSFDIVCRTGCVSVCATGCSNFSRRLAWSNR